MPLNKFPLPAKPSQLLGALLHSNSKLNNRSSLSARYSSAALQPRTQPQEVDSPVPVHESAQAIGGVTTTTTTTTTAMTPLYEFGPLSTEDTLLCEMRHVETPFQKLGAAFGVHPVTIFYRYLHVGSIALQHQWQPRMSAVDIEAYLQERIS